MKEDEIEKSSRFLRVDCSRGGGSTGCRGLRDGVGTGRRGKSQRQETPQGFDRAAAARFGASHPDPCFGSLPRTLQSNPFTTVSFIAISRAESRRFSKETSTQCITAFPSIRYRKAGGERS